MRGFCSGDSSWSRRMDFGLLPFPFRLMALGGPELILSPMH